MANAIAISKEQTRWTRHDEDVLIHFLRSNPCIWDTNHPSHQNRDRRNDLFVGAVGLLGNRFTAAEITYKYQNWRSQLRRELSRLARFVPIEQIAAGEVRSKWRLFDKLSFLINSIIAGSVKLNEGTSGATMGGLAGGSDSPQIDGPWEASSSNLSDDHLGASVEIEGQQSVFARVKTELAHSPSLPGVEVDDYVSGYSSEGVRESPDLSSSELPGTVREVQSARPVQQPHSDIEILSFDSTLGGVAQNEGKSNEVDPAEVAIRYQLEPQIGGSQLCRDLADRRISAPSTHIDATLCQITAELPSTSAKCSEDRGASSQRKRKMYTVDVEASKDQTKDKVALFSDLVVQQLREFSSDRVRDTVMLDIHRLLVDAKWKETVHTNVSNT